MAMGHLGDQIDIHGGAADLIFPHHTCEIAQSENASGERPFVQIWMHCGMVYLGEEKMSTSLGNLVLVRHANGFVTAYAHASELNVKKGDTIKRGQVIGKAGQTGNVASPQLHFEVRKGGTPVDPAKYLQGG